MRHLLCFTACALTACATYHVSTDGPPADEGGRSDLLAAHTDASGTNPSPVPPPEPSPSLTPVCSDDRPCQEGFSCRKGVCIGVMPGAAPSVEVTLGAAPPSSAGAGTRCWLGIAYAMPFGTSDGSGTAGPGAMIEMVFDGSPAKEAGLQPGDRVVSLDGHAIQDGVEARRVIAGLRPGQSVEVTYQRAGGEHQAKVVASSMPTTMSSSVTFVESGTGAQGVDRRAALQEALTQMKTACDRFRQQASAHPEDSGAQQEVQMCQQEIAIAQQAIQVELQRGEPASGARH